MRFSSFTSPAWQRSFSTSTVTVEFLFWMNPRDQMVFSLYVTGSAFVTGFVYAVILPAAASTQWNNQNSAGSKTGKQSRTATITQST